MSSLPNSRYARDPRQHPPCLQHQLTPPPQLNEREQANAAEALKAAHDAIVFLRRVELYNYITTPWGAPLDRFPLRVKHFIAWYWQCKTKDIAIWTWYMFCRWFHRRRLLGVDPYDVGDPPPQWFSGEFMPDEEVVGYVEKRVTARRVREAIGLVVDEEEGGESVVVEAEPAAGEFDGASEASSTEDTGDSVDGEDTVNQEVVPVPPTPVVLPPTPLPAIPPQSPALPSHEVIDLTADTPIDAPPTPVPQPTLETPAANSNPMDDFIASLALGELISMEEMELFAVMLGNSSGDGGNGQLETSLSSSGSFAPATSEDDTAIAVSHHINGVPLQPAMLVSLVPTQLPPPPSESPVQATTGPAPRPVEVTADPADSAQLIAEKNAALQQAAEMQRAAAEMQRKVEILEQEKREREKAEEAARLKRNAQSSHTRRVRKQKAREKEAAEAAVQAQAEARAKAITAHARSQRAAMQYIPPAPVSHMASPDLTPAPSQYSPNGHLASPVPYHPQPYAVACSPFPGTPATMAAAWSRPASGQQYPPQWQATGPVSNYSGSGAGTPYPMP